MTATQSRLALLADPVACNQLTEESILALAALEIINLIPREFVPPEWFKIHPCDDAPCSFLSVRNLEHLRIYWENQTQAASQELERLGDTIASFDENTSSAARKECDTRKADLVSLQCYASVNATYFADLIAQSEEKPCFLAHHYLDWFTSSYYDVEDSSSCDSGSPLLS